MFAVCGASAHRHLAEQLRDHAAQPVVSRVVVRKAEAEAPIPIKVVARAAA